MQEFFSAFQSMLNPVTIGFMILGTGVGIVFGAVPGLTATLAIAVFLPIVYKMETVVGFSLLMAVYIGSMSGNLITSILLGIPGKPSSVATTFDGGPMAQKGEGAKALGMAIVVSFLATVLSIFCLMFIGPWLANLAINFGPYEYFAITSCSLLLVSGLLGDSLPKGIISAIVGIYIGMVGMAPVDGALRYTFGIDDLMAGLNILPVIMGMFALPQLLNYARKELVLERLKAPKIKGFGFTFAEFRGQIGNFCRSWLIGFGIGILPTLGAAASNILAYAAAKKASKYPEKFGTGIIDGVVAPETANNATIGGDMITLLALGIPGDGVTAVMMGAFILKGLTLGPMFFTKYPDVVNVIFVALLVACFLMLVMEFYGLRIFVKIMNVPLHILLPIVMVFCAIGSFTSTNTIFSIGVFIVLGLVSFILERFDVPLTPMIIGYVLGPISETYLRRGLQMSHESFLPFIQSPIAGTIWAISILFIVWQIVRGIRTHMLKNNTNQA